jgi:hypothetical protein
MARVPDLPLERIAFIIRSWGTETEMRRETILNRLREISRALGEVIYGMSLYEWARELEKARGEQERLFVLIIYGDLLGVPILPPYHCLRLLPHVVPLIEGWRRSLLRERDLTDFFDQEIG